MTRREPGLGLGASVGAADLDPQMTLERWDPTAAVTYDMRSLMSHEHLFCRGTCTTLLSSGPVGGFQLIWSSARSPAGALRGIPELIDFLQAARKGWLDVTDEAGGSKSRGLSIFR